MKTYDWTVVGAGITGAALSYELAKKGFSVLLLEQHPALQNATRLSYAGVAYWAGTTELTRQVSAEGIALLRALSEELDANILFRELDLLLTVSAGVNPEQIAAGFANCAIPPRLLSASEACDLEPLLNPKSIAGALAARHGHVQPESLVRAYCQAFIRAGGAMQIAPVSGLLREGNCITGVTTPTGTIPAANVAICAGGLTRSTLKAAGIDTRVYFTCTELLETPPVHTHLRTCVMSATNQRLQLETRASTPEAEKLWDKPNRELAPAILDAGAIQFLDGRIKIGQISRVLTNPSLPNPAVDPAESEAAMRTEIAKILPALANLPATWHQCTVAFSPDQLPSIGEIPGFQGIHLFTGFSSPLVFVPPLARRFASFAATGTDEIVPQLSPGRQT